MAGKSHEYCEEYEHNDNLILDRRIAHQFIRLSANISEVKKESKKPPHSCLILPPGITKPLLQKPIFSIYDKKMYRHSVPSQRDIHRVGEPEAGGDADDKDSEVNRVPGECIDSRGHQDHRPDA